MLSLKSRTGKIFNEAFGFLCDEMRAPCCMPNQSDFAQYIHSSSNSRGWRASVAERLDFLGCRENTISRCNFQVLKSAIYSRRHGFAARFGQIVWKLFNLCWKSARIFFNVTAATMGLTLQYQYLTLLIP